jgi:NAD(P)-dependent dehydrogenase (short-subunit alcohol dehydrogenase family)
MVTDEIDPSWIIREINVQPRLQGKAIVVAGGGGIGGELARRYAREGAAVVLGDLDQDSAQKTVEEIRRAGGIAEAVRLDGGDEATIVEAVALAEKNFGGLHGFHANFANFADGVIDAGIVDLPLDVFDDVMRINCRGFVLCTRHAVPLMIKSGGGSMLYTSSGSAHAGDDTRAAYAMSKAAGHALMRHVARRYGPDGVRANAIAPGIIMHERLAGALGDRLEGFTKWSYSRMPIRSRLGNPGDIAALSALLMSDEGSYITGQVLSVDGGSTMRP